MGQLERRRRLKRTSALPLVKYLKLPQKKKKQKKQKKKKKSGLFDVQKWIGKTGIEFHVPGYQFLGPGTKLKKRLARGDQGINRLDRIAKQHDIDYSKAKGIEDKWAADTKMVKAIDRLPGKKTLTEKLARKVIQNEEAMENVMKE